MKKPLIAIGTILATAAPVAGVVSCTLIKNDHINSYVEFKHEDKIESIIKDFALAKGSNLGITPWLTSFWKERSNKLLGALNYKSNNNGIIASNGFSKNDLKALSRLLEAQTWLEYGGYNVKTVPGAAPTNEEKIKNDIRIVDTPDTASPARWYSDLNQVDGLFKWLSNFNINNGKFYKDGDKIQSFVNGKLQEFNAWNTEDERTFFNKENVFEKSSKIVNGVIQRPKDVEEEVLNEIGGSDHDSLRKFVASQVHKLSPTSGDYKYKFDQQRDGEEINFYIAYNINANTDAQTYDPEDVTIGNSGSYNGLNEKIQDWFKSFGISVKVIRVPLDGKGDLSTSSENIISTGPNAGKAFTIQTLADLANSDEKALVYMPVDSWLSSGKPKGSLLLQKRSTKTVGDIDFFEDDNTADSIKIDEPKLVEQIGEIYAAFPEFVSANDYSLIHFFDMMTLYTTLWSTEMRDAYNEAKRQVQVIRDQLYAKENELRQSGLKDDQIAAHPEIIALQKQVNDKNDEINNKTWYWSADPKWLETYVKMSTALRGGFFSKWIEGEDNVFRDRSTDYRKSFKSLPVINSDSKTIDYTVNNYLSTYSTQYIFSPDGIVFRDEAQRMFAEAIDKNAPKTSNHYSWTINARDALPLPVRIGYTNDEDGTLRSNILNWIQEHFIM